MRFGWLAAAAAMVCAVPASAARYYEFEIIGSARVTISDPAGLAAPSVYDRLSRFTASFDTQSSPSPDGYLATGVPEVITAFSTFNSTIRTLNMPGGTDFNLAFNLSSITAAFQSISTTGSYGYLNCNNRYQLCADSPARLFSVSARTRDTAPASLGETETVFITYLPEPASWALMILGVGMIGATARRKALTNRLPALA